MVPICNPASALKDEPTIHNVMDSPTLESPLSRAVELEGRILMFMLSFGRNFYAVPKASER